MEEEEGIRRRQECVTLVMIEMTSAVVGIFGNLMVVSSVRNQDHLQESTTNLLLANICFSNLMIAFLVKPISAIYVSYALSTGEWQVGLAFCSLYTLTYRTCLLVLPFSIAGLCWHTGGTISCWPGKGSSPSHSSQHSLQDPHLPAHIKETDEYRIIRAYSFPTLRQKAILAAMWVFPVMFGLIACFPDKMFKSDGRPQPATTVYLEATTGHLEASSGHFEASSGHQQATSPPSISASATTQLAAAGRNTDIVYCPVRTPPGDSLDTATLWLSVILPTTLGPLLSLLLWLLTLPCTWRDRTRPQGCGSCLLLPLLIIVHLVTYATHLDLSERLQLEEYHYLVVKYGLGQGFIILIPFIIIACKSDLRQGMRKTFSSSVLCPLAATVHTPAVDKQPQG